MRILAMLAVGAVVLAAAAGATESPAPSRPVPIHPNPAEIERGLADALLAFLVGDGRAVRTALDAVEDNCRRLGPDEQPGYPRHLVNWDAAFHGDLDAARELSARGLLDRAYDRFTFLPRGCLGCHAAAAKEGVLGTPGTKP